MSNKSATSLLMSVNQNDLKKPSKEVEIPRLSEICGQPFLATVKAVNMGQLKETLRSVDTNDIAGNFEYAALVVRYGLVDPLVTDKDLQKQMGAPNWEELLNKLFLPGEVLTLSQEILEVSDLDGESMKKKKAAKSKKAEKIEK